MTIIPILIAFVRLVHFNGAIELPMYIYMTRLHSYNSYCRNYFRIEGKRYGDRLTSSIYIYMFVSFYNENICKQYFRYSLTVLDFKLKFFTSVLDYQTQKP